MKKRKRGRGWISYFFFFKQKTAYEIYQCDWSSDVCSSDLLARRQWLNRVTIDATDIDRQCMALAEAARYRPTVFEEAPDHFREEYCVPVDDEYQVIPQLRSLVQVRHVDLMRDPPLTSEYDLVVCRNVVIYFDRPTQEQLYQTFADVLPEEKGVLVLGKVETLFGPVQKQFTLLDVRERIYRRCA